MPDDELPNDEVRTPKEVASRTLALFGVWRFAIGAPNAVVMDWLNENNLVQILSPEEKAFLENIAPQQKSKIKFSWHAERLVILLWAMRKIEQLPEATVHCDTDIFAELLPPFNKQSVSNFVESASLRPDDELFAEAERTENLHWQARENSLSGRPTDDPVDIEIVMERHHAINWVTGYFELDWDDVTTDT